MVFFIGAGANKNNMNGTSMREGAQCYRERYMHAEQVLCANTGAIYACKASAQCMRRASAQF